MWLGIFDSEEGVVWVVDVVRKFFKCKKKWGFNIFSVELDVYLEKILFNLKLINLLDDFMFKEVIFFVKKRV